eukprot:GHVU01040294.1.p1 GENE.GHVU01040294.1~~GHVU01040294.1.p1  ORF type:complete len:153 (+),score=11.24 GHVU01040294.1:180-638(+)
MKTVQILTVLMLAVFMANMQVEGRVCPDGFRSWSGSCYFFETNNQYTWAEAKSICRSLQSDLVSVGSTSENQFLLSWIRERSTKLHIWMDLNDLAREGHWMTKQMRISYSNWCRGEPNNRPGDEDCGHFHASHGHCWNDVGCWRKFGFICEA